MSSERASKKEREGDFGGGKLPACFALTSHLKFPSSSHARRSAIADMPVMNYLMIYHVFGLLWTAQFIQGIGAMTVAGAVCAWYFGQLPKEAEGNEEYEKLRYAKSRFPICGSLYRTVRYYLGTVAFGSLLIAFIQFVRLVFAYIQKKLEPRAKNNASLRFILCCIQCCLKCLQSLVETVTRNAYIFTALKGGSFCTSGGMVFKLIVSHGTVFAAVNVLGEIIMFLGKVRRGMAEEKRVEACRVQRRPSLHSASSQPERFLPFALAPFFLFSFFSHISPPVRSSSPSPAPGLPTSSSTAFPISSRAARPPCPPPGSPSSLPSSSRTLQPQAS